MKKSKKKLLLTSLVLGGSLFIVGTATATSVLIGNAEEASSSTSELENNSSESIEDNESIDSEVTSEKNVLQDISDSINNFKDTYLTPLLGGASIAVVLQSILSIIVAITNRKSTIKNREDIKNCTDTVEGVTNLSKELKEQVDKIISELKEQNEIAGLNKQELKNATDRMLLEMERITNYTQDFSEVKESIKALSSIIVKLALLQDDVIKSGVGEEIKKLEDFINRE